jgi:hypothetical protein
MAAFFLRLHSQIVALALSLLMSPAAVFGQSGAAEFSRDGRFLHVVGRFPGAAGEMEHVRAVTYLARTGAVVHVINLQPDTSVGSTTSDGRTAIIETGASGQHPGLSLLDTETGRLEAIPDSWYQPDSELDAELSGDGRLVSIYSETDSAAPMTVTVYDWKTKTLVTRRTSEYVAAGGGMSGGVTWDGAVAFEGNRVGSTIVDLTTGRVMAQFGPSAVRSPDGAWAVQFPNLNWDESSSKDVLVKDGKDGHIVGKLDAQVPESELDGALGGAFCGTSGRFVIAGAHSVAAYVLSSGKRLASFPEPTWKDASTGDGVSVVACSPAGTRVAIFSGARVTFHDLK